MGDLLGVCLSMSGWICTGDRGCSFCRMKELAQDFEEVQAFFSYRTSDCYSWTKYVQGSWSARTLAWMTSLMRISVS